MRLDEVSQLFKLAYEYLHKLVVFAHSQPIEKNVEPENLVANLKQYFKNYHISLDTKHKELDASADSIIDPAIVFKQPAHTWSIDLNFFTSPELHILLNLYASLTSLELEPWTLQIIDKEKTITGIGILPLFSAVRTISKTYMNVQRYKGLGEMNPDQLWETSMDAKTRNLLQVTIEDALAADSWFSTLMGDDVMGRKQYIEEYGQFVRNLDV